ncbi:MAG: hypothetical protein COB49_06130 [Alphaproteobacteria bacterium]|nr:MAG: hypothetical protein COB49_06130 [Alphaproteobacteria bacterium]
MNNVNSFGKKNNWIRARYNGGIKEVNRNIMVNIFMGKRFFIHSQSNKYYIEALVILFLNKILISLNSYKDLPVKVKK